MELLDAKSPDVRLRASEALLDRALGRPRQAVELEVRDDEEQRDLQAAVEMLAVAIAEKEAAALIPSVQRLPNVTGLPPEPTTLDVQPEQRALPEPARSHMLDGAKQRPTPPWRDPE